MGASLRQVCCICVSHTYVQRQPAVFDFTFMIKAGSSNADVLASSQTGVSDKTVRQ